jgi:NAD(P)H-hydrate epimerase
MWIAPATHIRDIDRRATGEFGIPAKVLMERAGLAVFNSVREMLPDGGHISVFCGRGNNGGDGFVVARLAYQNRFGVDCLVAGVEADLRPEARDQMNAMRAVGLEPIFYGDPAWMPHADCVGCRDLIVDALLGTGASCEVAGPVKIAIQSINRGGVPVLSVDVPSGVHCDTGDELGESVWALRTVTFGMPKPFLFQGIGIEHSGYWTVAEIGYPSALLNSPTEAKMIENEWVGSLLPERLRASNKGDNGHVLIVAGSDTMAGAAVLAARGAIRSGAGLVTVASTPRVCSMVNIHLPEVLTLPLPETEGVIDLRAIEPLLARQNRYTSALFGPGLTHSQPVCDLLERVWSEWTIPCVIDADALNAVSEGVSLPAGDCVLTPHPGEMSRLLRNSVAEIQADRFQTVRQAASQFGKTVLLKGPYSIVGERNQPMLVNSTGNPGLASGGMGDVLAGITATLLAQELPGYEAIACAAYWHGFAADQCAIDIGAIGYTASDVSNMLPSARVKIVESCAQRPSC